MQHIKSVWFGVVVGAFVVSGVSAGIVLSRRKKRQREDLAKFAETFGTYNEPRDLVDEMSWESFPASDPPARTPIAHFGAMLEEKARKERKKQD